MKLKDSERMKREMVGFVFQPRNKNSDLWKAIFHFSKQVWPTEIVKLRSSAEKERVYPANKLKRECPMSGLIHWS